MLQPRFQTPYRTGFFCYGFSFSSSNLQGSACHVHHCCGFMRHWFCLYWYMQQKLLVATDMKASEAFHMKCQCHCVRYWKFAGLTSSVMSTCRHVQVSRHCAKSWRARSHFGFHRATMPSQDVRLSVRPSVCLSHAGIVSKRLHISSKFFHRRVAPPF